MPRYFSAFNSGRSYQRRSRPPNVSLGIHQEIQHAGGNDCKRVSAVGAVDHALGVQAQGPHAEQNRA